MRMQEETLRSDFDRQNWIRFISAMPLDKPVKVTAQVVRKGRTLSQNATIWMWATHVADDFTVRNQLSDPYDKDRVYNAWAQMFAPLEENPLAPGEFIHKRPSQMDVAEMAVFMEEIIAWCYTNAIYPKIPEEMHNAV